MTVGRILPEAVCSMFKKTATVRYPFEKMPVPPGFRGAPVVDSDACIGCKICARDCPAKAIEMVDVGAKLPRPAFHYDRCVYCALCADVCPKKAITLTENFELASTVRGSLRVMPARPKPPREEGASKHETEQG